MELFLWYQNEDFDHEFMCLQVGAKVSSMNHSDG